MKRIFVIAAVASATGLGLAAPAVAGETSPPTPPTTCEQAQAAVDQNRADRQAADERATAKQKAADEADARATQRDAAAAEADQRATEKQEAANAADQRATELQEAANAADARATEKEAAAADAEANGNPDRAAQFRAEAQQSRDRRDQFREDAATARDNRDQFRSDAADSRDRRDQFREDAQQSRERRDQFRTEAQQSREKRDSLDDALPGLIDARDKACAGQGGQGMPSAHTTTGVCDPPGVNVVLDNSKVDEETTFTVTSLFGKDDHTQSVTVPAGETKTVVTPATEDVRGTITVTANGETLLAEAGVLTCEAGGGAGEFPAKPPAAEVEPQGSHLPFTGSPLRLIAGVALALIAAGAATLGGLRLARR